ncbi:glutamate 5-kinase [Hydrogenivirga caldilitoris]|uniref:Glutamate 5-kinase n=1 Tax=Hydrogenivirga caldilitoris TaxID=246264 RepID=A0A497XPN0_9AQUI|nr:glutamate 5-kinase [Hydrogenivirga caldilitoris]RLJ70917.1 glutamate 5-kinase [Hydrogenivirga caldilitoris]
MRIVFKVGSNLLQTERNDIDLKFIAKLAESFKELREKGDQLLLVSSGAVLCGAKKLGYGEKPNELTLRQALAGIGQAYLMHLYDTVFSNYGLTVAQVLLTNDIFRKENEDRFANAQNTLEKLLELGVIPVVNENDTVAVSELVFGDNDFLSVYVSYMLKADLLVILSSAGGLLDEEGNLVQEVRDMEEAFRFVKGTGSKFGSGGMRSKLEATRLAVSIGIPVIITGKEDNLVEVRELKTAGTLFRPVQRRLRGRLKSIAMIEEPKGAIVIDDGAVEALRKGMSLLPAGVIRAEGSFSAGDVVSVMNSEGIVIGKGRVNFSKDEIEKVKGLKGAEVKKLLKTQKEEVIHRDHLVVFQ